MLEVRVFKAGFGFKDSVRGGLECLGDAHKASWEAPEPFCRVFGTFDDQYLELAFSEGQEGDVHGEAGSVEFVWVVTLEERSLFNLSLSGFGSLAAHLASLSVNSIYVNYR